MGHELSVSVDRDFARFGRKTYAINKINSVEVRERQPYGTSAMLIFGLLALLFGLSGIGQFGGADNAGGGVTMLLFAAGFAYLAYRAWLKSKIIEYQLYLMVSSSEAQAVASRDGKWIEDLQRKIERAMAGNL